MKVKDASTTQAAKARSLDIKKPPGGSAAFLDAVKSAEDKNVVERLRAKAVEIAAQGEKLADKVDIRELRVYKKMVSDFMDEAVGNSRKFSKQSFLDRRGRHKVYAVIKKVNEELDDLTREVLQGEKDRLKILKKLDDIKGLILDIVM
ncbi:MAG: YaaR family protein [Oscillospiraceae bacterium]|nr:YaaR family protein [Oscillospiraceae bacterium]